MASAAPTLAEQLTWGNDPRLALHHGINTYACPPIPDTTLLALGSCTASPISQSAWNQLCQPQPRLTIEQASAQWLALCGLPANAGITLSPSGTELHAEWFSYCKAQSRTRPVHVVTFCAQETGRGVPAILASADQVIEIALRDTQGHAKHTTKLDAAFLQAAIDCWEQGAHCLLITSDVSKSGLSAPSWDGLQAILQHAQTNNLPLTTLVDACQFRCTPKTVRAYLDAGCWVALTGSKFMGGPSFSAALLHLQYALPEVYRDHQTLTGLRLRTEAALHDTSRFLGLPANRIQTALAAFAETAAAALKAATHLEPIPTPNLARPQPDWDRIPTIFPFAVTRDGQTVSAAALLQLRDGLIAPHTAPRIYLGQPVELAPQLHALRLCSSARWVLNAVEQGLDAALTELTQAIHHIDAQTQLIIAG